MEGTNLYRASLAVAHMVLRPRDAARWITDSVFDRRSALERGLPWIAWKAVDYLMPRVRPGMRVFEWGGGGSTVFFAARGCLVTTAESSPDWKKLIEQRCRAVGVKGSVEIRLVPAESKDPAAIAAYVDTVRDGAPWDIILVDGLEESYLSRMSCISEVPAALAPAGMALLDDAYRTAYREVPTLLAGWKRRVCRGLGVARKGVTQTDIFSPPT